KLSIKIDAYLSRVLFRVILEQQLLDFVYDVQLGLLPTDPFSIRRWTLSYLSAKRPWNIHEDILRRDSTFMKQCAYFKTRVTYSISAEYGGIRVQKAAYA